MKFYHVVLRPEVTTPKPAEDNTALLRMELLVSVGDRARHAPAKTAPFGSVPTTIGEVIKGTLSDLQLTGLMHIAELDEITEEEAQQYV